MKLDGKVAIVTGSGKGIGRAIALRLAGEGCSIMICDLDEESAISTRNEISERGGKAVALKTDATSFDHVKQMVKKTLEEFGRIDILVNNVGWDDMKIFMDTDEEFWDKIIAINYKSVLNCCKAVLEHMVERKEGKIINISSEAGRVGSLGEAVYSGTKGAIIAFTKSLAREMARNNINVNCVCPGLTDTPLLSGIMAKSPLAGKVIPAIINATPIRRLGKPEEIADAVLFLASDDSSFITGQTLSVSGGLTMA